ncbi:helix-turn-helix domain-containing protein (plasmid) [Defluviimonas sp. SAOS-178_SWC]
MDDPDDPEAAAAGLYDPDPVSEENLWFLPGEVADELDLLPPGPRAERRPLFDPAEWGAAQDRLSADLAELTLLFGALDERLRAGPPERTAGWRHRLALLEVADLGWWTGERIGIERLALWVGLRLGAVGADAQALARAGWAVRRLSGGPGPEAGGWEAGLTAFLGRSAPTGEEAVETVSDLAEIMAGAGGLHPVTRAAMLFHAWRMLGQGGATDVEAAAMAARHAATMARGGGALFLPLALTGPTALRAAGAVPDRLSRWIAGATQAVLAALLHLDRIRDWQARAETATRDLSGRTPARLIEALTAWPMLSAPMAEELTGASRAAAQRNLDTLAARGLIREVTGQGRYRVWAAME